MWEIVCWDMVSYWLAFHCCVVGQEERTTRQFRIWWNAGTSESIRKYQVGHICVQNSDQFMVSLFFQFNSNSIQVGFSFNSVPFPGHQNDTKMWIQTFYHLSPKNTSPALTMRLRFQLQRVFYLFTSLPHGLNYVDLCSPRARSLLFMFLRSKGLNILSYVEFCVDFRTELLTNQLLCVRSEIYVMWTKVRSKMIIQV